MFPNRILEDTRMEINITEEKGKRLEFEIDENVGFLNLLKKELLNDSTVDAATYFVASFGGNT